MATGGMSLASAAMKAHTVKFLIVLVIICQTHRTSAQVPSEPPPNVFSKPVGELKSSSSLTSDKITQVHSAAGLGPTINHPDVTRREPTASRHKRSPAPLTAGQFNLMPPKLVQWSKEPVQYYEGSTLVLSCSLSVSGEQLKFSWFKNGKPLAGDRQQQQQQRLSIETLTDYSFLRLADLRPSDSGAYTCMASNSLGQEDRTTTQVIVNVKLKWISGSGSSSSSTIQDEDNLHTNRTFLNGETGNQFVKSRANQRVSFECNVAGGLQPRPRVRWFRLAQTAGNGHSMSGIKLKPTGPRMRLEPGSLDETQIKLTLSQLDTPQGDLQMQRFELVEDGTHEKTPLWSFNESQSVRWHIETSSSPASSGKNQQEVYSRLVLDRVEASSSGFYECDVGSALDQPANHLVPSPDGSSSMLAPTSGTRQSGDKLRRLFGLLVNGK